MQLVQRSFGYGLHGMPVLSLPLTCWHLYIESGFLKDDVHVGVAGHVFKDADAASDVNVTKVIACLSTCPSKERIVIVLPRPLSMPSLGLRWGFLSAGRLTSPMLCYPYLYCIISAAHPRPCLSALKVCVIHM